MEITYAGQAFRLGRYPIHFHLNGIMTGSYVRGCSIHHTFNRAINIHNTHNVLIENNVAYDVMGGAFFLEDSIERDNILQYNLLVFVKASSSLLNDDVTPAAFWVTHPSNIVRHNNVAGGTHFGFWYRMHKTPIGPSYTPSICPRNAPLGEFYNNTVHSVGWYGLWVFEFYDPKKDGICDSDITEPAKFRKLITWNSFRGAEWVECGAIQFIDFIVANNYMAGLEASFVHDNIPMYSEEGAMFKDSVIIGHLNDADHPPCTHNGLVLPFGNGLTIQNVTFVNFDGSDPDRLCTTMSTAKIICICTTLCSGYDYKFKQITWINSNQKANYEWHFEMELTDEDGSLTGHPPGSKVLAKTGILPDSCTVSVLYFND